MVSVDVLNTFVSPLGNNPPVVKVKYQTIPNEIDNIKQIVIDIYLIINIILEFKTKLIAKIIANARFSICREIYKRNKDFLLLNHNL